MARVLILYYSSYGHLETMANNPSTAARGGSFEAMKVSLPDLLLHGEVTRVYRLTLCRISTCPFAISKMSQAP